MRAQHPNESEQAALPVAPHQVLARVRWESVDGHASRAGADLDLSCFLLDRQGRVVEVVHPGKARNSNASVVRPGVRQPGRASHREMLFLMPMLPLSVSALVLVVSSPPGDETAAGAGASCDVSDPATDQTYLRANLANAERKTAYCVAALERGAAGWKVVPRVEIDAYRSAMIEMLAITAGSKVWDASFASSSSFI